MDSSEQQQSVAAMLYPDPPPPPLQHKDSNMSRSRVVAFGSSERSGLYEESSLGTTASGIVAHHSMRQTARLNAALRKSEQALLAAIADASCSSSADAIEHMLRDVACPVNSVAQAICNVIGLNAIAVDAFTQMMGGTRAPTVENLAQNNLRVGAGDGNDRNNNYIDAAGAGGGAAHTTDNEAASFLHNIRKLSDDISPSASTSIARSPPPASVHASPTGSPRPTSLTDEPTKKAFALEALQRILGAMLYMYRPETSMMLHPHHHHTSQQSLLGSSSRPSLHVPSAHGSGGGGGGDGGAASFGAFVGPATATATQQQQQANAAATATTHVVTASPTPGSTMSSSQHVVLAPTSSAAPIMITTTAASSTTASTMNATSNSNNNTTVDSSTVLGGGAAPHAQQPQYQNTSGLGQSVSGRGFNTNINNSASNNFISASHSNVNNNIHLREPSALLAGTAHSMYMDASIRSISRAAVAQTSNVVDTVDTVGMRYVNQYMLLESCGIGSQGQVFCALDTVSNEYRAIKVLQRVLHQQQQNGGNVATARSLLVASEIARRIKNEVKILQRCRHPNVVALFEVIDDPSRDEMFLVMQFVEHGALFHCSASGTATQTFSVDVFLQYAKQLCAGLAYLHRRSIAHRDIKPENILRGALDVVCLADFGVSDMWGAAHTTAQQQQQQQSSKDDSIPPGTATASSLDITTSLENRIASVYGQGRRCGTTAFLAPELLTSETASSSPCDQLLQSQHSGSHHSAESLTPQQKATGASKDTEALRAADVWALGLTFYAMLYGKLPWNSQDPAEYIDHVINSPFEIPKHTVVLGRDGDTEVVPRSIRIILSRMLHRDVAFRASIFDVRAALKEVIAMRERQQLSESGSPFSSAPHQPSHHHQPAPTPSATAVTTAPVVPRPPEMERSDSNVRPTGRKHTLSPSTTMDLLPTSSSS